MKKFQKQIDLAIPILSTPSNDFCKNKIITKRPADTRGLVITLIPATLGDPLQAQDGKFYLRIRDEFKEMPYETLKRMFAGTVGPDLQPLFDNRLIQLKPDGSWKIPFILTNQSSTAARDTEVSVTINNETSCDQISGEGFIDESEVNPGRKIFMMDVKGPIYRGKNMLVGSLIVKMKKIKVPKRKLDLTIDIFSSNMRAKTYSMSIQLAKKGFSVKRIESRYLY